MPSHFKTTGILLDNVGKSWENAFNFTFRKVWEATLDITSLILCFVGQRLIGQGHRVKRLTYDNIHTGINVPKHLSNRVILCNVFNTLRACLRYIASFQLFLDPELHGSTRQNYHQYDPNLCLRKKRRTAFKQSVKWSTTYTPPPRLTVSNSQGHTITTFKVSK